MMHAAERQHLRAIFAGRDMADRLALRAHRRGLRAEMAVGVDLHLDAAIAEDAFGHDRDHVDAVDLRRHDEGRGLVIGIGGAGADRGDEHVRARGRSCRPNRRAAWNGTSRPPCDDRALQHDMRIDAHQFAVVIGIAIAGARRARLDVAHHRTGIAADLVVGSGGRRISQHEQACTSMADVDHAAAFRAHGHFVRIRTMLRADRNLSSGVATRKCRVADNNLICLAALVHKPGSGAAARNGAACTFVYKRYLRQRSTRCLQRNRRAGPGA